MDTSTILLIGAALFFVSSTKKAQAEADVEMQRQALEAKAKAEREKANSGAAYLSACATGALTGAKVAGVVGALVGCPVAAGAVAVINNWDDVRRFFGGG